MSDIDVNRLEAQLRDLDKAARGTVVTASELGEVTFQCMTVLGGGDGEDLVATVLKRDGRPIDIDPSMIHPDSPEVNACIAANIAFAYVADKRGMSSITLLGESRRENDPSLLAGLDELPKSCGDLAAWFQRADEKIANATNERGMTP